MKIGITGGIASGKSKLLKYLSTKSRVYALNLDLIGHKVYELNPIAVKNLGLMFKDQKAIKKYYNDSQPENHSLLSVN